MQLRNPRKYHLFHDQFPQKPLTKVSSQAPQIRAKPTLRIDSLRLSNSPSGLHSLTRRFPSHASSTHRTHLTRIVQLIETQKCSCPEDVALTVIKAYAKNSMPDKALDSFQRMKQIFGCEPGVRSYNTLLNAFAESNRWEEAESFFKYFETVGMEPNLQTYNILIKVACKKKHFKDAKRLLDWLWKMGFQPNVQSYGGLINGLVKGGNLVIALEVFDEMFERKVISDVMCYNILIDGFFKNRDFVKANEIWERLLEDFFGLSKFSYL